MEIRRATPAQVPTLVALMTECYGESGYAFDPSTAEAAFDVLLDDPALGAVWIAALDGVEAGYIVLTVGFSLEYGGRDAFVDDLFVRPACRRRGLARRLLDALLDECRRRDARALHLEVERGNAPARRLYLARGFRDHDRQLLTLRLSGHDAD